MPLQGCISFVYMLIIGGHLVVSTYLVIVHDAVNTGVHPFESASGYIPRKIFL